jgi:hypothetical protein
MDGVHVGPEHHGGALSRSGEPGYEVTGRIDADLHALSLKLFHQVGCPGFFEPGLPRDLCDVDPLFYLGFEIGV